METAIGIVQTLESDALLLIWECLRVYNPDEEHSPGVSMDDWANLVYGEISARRLAWA